tara:strand:+ start:205 stop:519 length:315 start_codon:yes stop_codon:yes gene_type:complete
MPLNLENKAGFFIHLIRKGASCKSNLKYISYAYEELMSENKILNELTLQELEEAYCTFGKGIEWKGDFSKGTLMIIDKLGLDYGSRERALTHLEAIFLRMHFTK